MKFLITIFKMNMMYIVDYPLKPGSFSQGTTKQEAEINI